MAKRRFVLEPLSELGAAAGWGEDPEVLVAASRLRDCLRGALAGLDETPAWKASAAPRW